MCGHSQFSDSPIRAMFKVPPFVTRLFPASVAAVVRQTRTFCSMRRRPTSKLRRPAVAVFEPDDVVQLGRRDFEDIAVVMAVMRWTVSA